MPSWRVYPRDIVKPGLFWIASVGVLTFAAGQWVPDALPAAYLALLAAALVTVIWGALVVVRHQVWWLLASAVPDGGVYAANVGFGGNSESGWSVLTGACVVVAVLLAVGGGIGGFWRNVRFSS